MDTNTLNTIKEACFWIILAALPIAWFVSSAVSGWKEYHRHIEVNAFINMLSAQVQKIHDENTKVCFEALAALSRQKSLILIRI